MGLTAPHLKYLIRIKKRMKFKGPLLTLGCQDIYATEENVVNWMREERLPRVKVNKVHYTHSKGMSEVNNEYAKYIHAKSFFEYLGIPLRDYYDIDKFDFDKPKILHDLEKKVHSKYHNFFNFIIDGCTLTHILDVKSVLTNIVKMTKMGGHVLHINPAQTFLNHGFFQFSPTFFYDFYHNNGFQIVESYLIEIRGNTYRFHTYDQKKHYLGIYLNPKNRLINCFLLRKVKHMGQVSSPNQYVYDLLSKKPKKVMKDWDKTLIDRLASLSRRVVPIKYHGLFFDLWSLLKRRTQNTTYFDIEQ